MTAPLRIGIAGLGTVGGGVVDMLRRDGEAIAQRTGRPIEIAAVSARTRHKDRHADIKGLRWVDDPLAMASDPDIDVVVETIGGAEGIARELVTRALENGKSVVTANKALIATHGVELAELAEQHGVVLAFEAAVAGGIPIINNLRDGSLIRNVQRITGILNGTCNYILTTMWKKKCGFEEALKEAQEKGYAEADPGLDIDGGDTAHKLAILASLAYGITPRAEGIRTEGIRSVSLRDMEFADTFGYRIKLLGVAEKTDRGVVLSVRPSLVRKASRLASIHGVHNAVLTNSQSGRFLLLEGEGAGSEPTASSIIADLTQIAQGASYKPFGFPAASLNPAPAADPSQSAAAYYLRLGVKDQPGALSAITHVLEENGISVSTVNQPPSRQGETAQLALITHETSERAMQNAIRVLEKLDTVTEKPYMMRIEPDISEITYHPSRQPAANL